MLKYLPSILLGLLLLFTACDRTDDDCCDPVVPPTEPPVVNEPDLTAPAGTTPIPEGQQRTGGDEQRGYEYLLYGDFVDSGIPLDLYLSIIGEDNGNFLNRDGVNAKISPNFTAVTAPNGVEVVGPNCFTCHAQVINGEYVVGLGNSFGNYVDDNSNLISSVDLAITFAYGQDSPEWEAYQPFRRAALATGPHVVAESRGVNIADKLTAVLAAYRDPQTLVWQDDPIINFPDEVVPTDVPAWWLMKKKNAMFYNGSGRGDHARIMMASNLLTMADFNKAAQVDQEFKDVYAFIKNMEAPTYPFGVDAEAALRGEELFLWNCAKCHGTYGDEETYPNLIVPLDQVQTDPMLVSYEEDYSEFVDWFNNGWFGQGANAAEFVYGTGYVAPPLDGVWATAPYLHNGSVPDLWSLLNSNERPVYWERTFENDDYNYDKVGWNYETPIGPGNNPKVYDTTLPGYTNVGHYYGDAFTDAERRDLIEYLKTM